MDEKAAEAMGINITYYKVLSFTQGAILAGFAGALYAHVLAYISPADFAYHRAIDILIFSIFGGSEVIWGAIFGATFMTLLPEALRFISEYRYMIYGIILIVLMAFRPQGIIDVPVLNWLKRTFTFKRRDSNGIRVKKYN
ncbi:MAG: branched-chain amino acid ABC transporter permease, partial [Psychrobacillus sp.]